MISWLLALLASSQVPYELLALVQCCSVLKLNKLALIFFFLIVNQIILGKSSIPQGGFRHHPLSPLYTHEYFS